MGFDRNEVEKSLLKLWENYKNKVYHYCYVIVNYEKKFIKFAKRNIKLMITKLFR